MNKPPVHAPTRRVAVATLLLSALLLVSTTAFAAGDASPRPAAPLPTAATRATVAVVDDLDDPPTRSTFRRGMRLYLEGDYKAAAKRFGDVARTSRDPDRRAAADRLRGLSLRGPALAGAGEAGDLTSSDEDAVSGRTSFILTTTLASLYAGVVLTDILNVGDDPRLVVLLLTGSTAGGLLGSIYGTRGIRISSSTGAAYSSGIIWGLVNGGLISAAIDYDTTEAVQTTILLSMAAGGTAGFLIGRRYDPTRAQVHATGAAGFLGLVTAAFSYMVVQPEEPGFRRVMLTHLLAYNAATALGAYAVKDIDWSLSRSRLVSLSGVLGAVAGWSLVTLVMGFDNDNTVRAWGGSMLAGTWGGVAMGIWLTEGMAPDKRFSREPATEVSLTPTILPAAQGRTAPGLAVVGRF